MARSQITMSRGRPFWFATDVVENVIPVQLIAIFPKMWEDFHVLVEWRSGSAGALQAQGRGFKSLLDHHDNKSRSAAVLLLTCFTFRAVLPHDFAAHPANPGPL